MVDKDTASIVISVLSLAVSGTGWLVTYHLGQRAARLARDKQRAESSEDLIWAIADLGIEIYMLPGNDPTGRQHQRKIVGQFDKAYSKLGMLCRDKQTDALNRKLDDFWEICTGLDSTDFSRVAFKQGDQRINDLRACASEVCREIQHLVGS